MSLVRRSSPWHVTFASFTNVLARFDLTAGAGLASSVALTGFGVGLAFACGVAFHWSTRDGFGVLQYFVLPSLTLMVWLTLFATSPLLRADRLHAQPLGGVVWWVFGLVVAMAVIDWRAGGASWAPLGFAVVGYAAAAGAAWRRGARLYGAVLVVGVQLLAGLAAFAITSGAWSSALAAAFTVVLAVFLLLARGALPAPVRDGLANIEHWIRETRRHAGLLALAVFISMTLTVILSGNVWVVGKLLTPVIGLAATRLLAEELLLRVWLLPDLQRRFGATTGIMVAATLSGVIGALAWPNALWLPGLAAGAIGGVASGALWTKTRSAPVIILFRLLTL